jgi:hypothetical protein
MNRQQRRAKLREIHQNAVCPRILAAITDVPYWRKLGGVFGALTQLLMELPRDQREDIVCDATKTLIEEMRAIDGLDNEGVEDRLIQQYGDLHKPPTGTA